MTRDRLAIAAIARLRPRRYSDLMVMPMFGSHRADATRASQRSIVMARRGMVCTSQPLATEAGVAVLRDGGHAVDAAVCAAAVLGVVEPFMTGVGGDCFMLIWDARSGTLHGLNGSGRAPRDASAAAVRERGHDTMPSHGPLAVTVPGTVDAWAEALARFGRRALGDVLTPAIEYAEHGFPVSEVIAFQWQLTAGFLDEAGRAAFTVDGAPPQAGQVVRLPELARTLRQVADGGPDAFYRGPLAAEIGAHFARLGGWLSADDLAAHASSWVEPIRTSYRGVELAEIPPNGQGIAALIALNILECFDLGRFAPDDPAALHARIEAIKLAFADRDRYVADPEHAAVPVPALLSKDYAQGRAALVRPDRALKTVAPGRVEVGRDTVYLTVVDGDGNAVSLINSLYWGFGSGVVVPGTGIAFQNRGFGFSLDPEHPNCLAPGKRPFHTIIPAMLLRDGRPLVTFGVMGGDMQPQGHLQVVSNLVDYGDNVQEAIDRARFNYLDTDRVSLEAEFSETTVAELRRRGHQVLGPDEALLRGGFGGGQGIAIHPETGVLWGGSDRRKDGCAMGF